MIVKIITVVSRRARYKKTITGFKVRQTWAPTTDLGELGFQLLTSGVKKTSRAWKGEEGRLGTSQGRGRLLDTYQVRRHREKLSTFWPGLSLQRDWGGVVPVGREGGSLGQRRRNRELPERIAWITVEDTGSGVYGVLGNREQPLGKETCPKPEVSGIP